MASFQNLSTVAIFFSGVNASTIQYSYSIAHSPLSIAVNVFWFLSLILSAASAINSQFAIAWLSSRYRSPARYMPRAATWAITQAPLVLLGVSACSFLFGLVCFAFHTFGSRSFLSITISSAAGLVCASLLSITLWQTGELYIGRHPSAGHSWLWPYLCSKKVLLWRLCGYANKPYQHMHRLAKSLVAGLLSFVARRCRRSLDHKHPKILHRLPSPSLDALEILRSTDRAQGFDKRVYPAEDMDEDLWGREYSNGPPIVTPSYFDILNTDGDPLRGLWEHLTPSFKLSLKIPIQFVSLSPDGTHAILGMANKLVSLGPFPLLHCIRRFVHPEGWRWNSEYFEISRNGRFFMARDIGSRADGTSRVWLWDIEVYTF